MPPRNGKNVICKVCLKEFYVPNYRVSSAKFCSIHCQNHKQYDKWIFNCVNCKKECVAPPSRRNYRKKFCSIECTNSKRQTDKELRKKIKALNVLSRGNNSSRRLRNNIFKIKKPQCEICGYNEYDFNIDLHHIDKNCNNNELHNISILCVMCHRKLHKGVINEQQIYENRNKL